MLTFLFTPRYNHDFIIILNPHPPPLQSLPLALVHLYNLTPRKTLTPQLRLASTAEPCRPLTLMLLSSSRTSDRLIKQDI